MKIEILNFKYIAALLFAVIITISCLPDKVDLGGQVNPSSLTIAGNDGTTSGNNGTITPINVGDTETYTTPRFYGSTTYDWTITGDADGALLTKNENIANIVFAKVGSYTLNLTVNGITSSKTITVSATNSGLLSFVSERPFIKGGADIFLMAVAPYPLMNDILMASIDAENVSGVGNGEIRGINPSNLLGSAPNPTGSFVKVDTATIRSTFPFLPRDSVLIKQIQTLIVGISGGAPTTFYAAKYRASNTGNGAISFKTRATTYVNGDAVTGESFSNILFVDNTAPFFTNVSFASPMAVAGIYANRVLGSETNINGSFTFSEVLNNSSIKIGVDYAIGGTMTGSTVTASSSDNTQYDLSFAPSMSGDEFTVSVLTADIKDRAENAVLTVSGGTLLEAVFYRDKDAPTISGNGSYQSVSGFYNNSSFRPNGQLTLDFSAGGFSFNDASVGNSSGTTDLIVHYAVTEANTFRTASGESLMGTVVYLNDSAGNTVSGNYVSMTGNVITIMAAGRTTVTGNSVIPITVVSESNLKTAAGVLNSGRTVVDYGSLTTCCTSLSPDNSVTTGNIRYLFRNVQLNRSQADVWYYVEDLAGNKTKVVKAGTFNLN